MARTRTLTHGFSVDFAGCGGGAGLPSLLELTNHQAAMPTRNAAPKPVLAYGCRAYACMSCRARWLVRSQPVAWGGSISVAHRLVDTWHISIARPRIVMRTYRNCSPSVGGTNPFGVSKGFSCVCLTDDASSSNAFWNDRSCFDIREAGGPAHLRDHELKLQTGIPNGQLVA